MATLSGSVRTRAVTHDSDGLQAEPNEAFHTPREGGGGGGGSGGQDSTPRREGIPFSSRHLVKPPAEEAGVASMEVELEIRDDEEEVEGRPTKGGHTARRPRQVSAAEFLSDWKSPGGGRQVDIPDRDPNSPGRASSMRGSPDSMSPLSPKRPRLLTDDDEDDFYGGYGIGWDTVMMAAETWLACIMWSVLHAFVDSMYWYAKTMSAESHSAFLAAGLVCSALLPLVLDSRCLLHFLTIRINVLSGLVVLFLLCTIMPCNVVDAQLARAILLGMSSFISMLHVGTLCVLSGKIRRVQRSPWAFIGGLLLLMTMRWGSGSLNPLLDTQWILIMGCCVGILCVALCMLEDAKWTPRGKLVTVGAGERDPRWPPELASCKSCLCEDGTIWIFVALPLGSVLYMTFSNFTSLDALPLLVGAEPNRHSSALVVIAVAVGLSVVYIFSRYGVFLFISTCGSLLCGTALLYHAEAQDARVAGGVMLAYVLPAMWWMTLGEFRVAAQHNLHVGRMLALAGIVLVLFTLAHAATLFGDQVPVFGGALGSSSMATVPWAAVLVWLLPTLVIWTMDARYLVAKDGKSFGALGWCRRRKRHMNTTGHRTSTHWRGAQKTRCSDNCFCASSALGDVIQKLRLQFFNATVKPAVILLLISLFAVFVPVFLHNAGLMSKGDAWYRNGASDAFVVSSLDVDEGQTAQGYPNFVCVLESLEQIDKDYCLLSSHKTQLANKTSPSTCENKTLWQPRPPSVIALQDTGAHWFTSNRDIGGYLSRIMHMYLYLGAPGSEGAVGAPMLSQLRPRSTSFQVLPRLHEGARRYSMTRFEVARNSTSTPITLVNVRLGQVGTEETTSQLKWIATQLATATGPTVLIGSFAHGPANATRNAGLVFGALTATGLRLMPEQDQAGVPLVSKAPSSLRDFFLYRRLLLSSPYATRQPLKKMVTGLCGVDAHCTPRGALSARFQWP